MTLTEKDIENEILTYLAYVGRGFFWKCNNVGVYDPRIGAYRKAKSKHIIRGVSDILGVLDGRFVAIEVKKPGGKVSEHQQNYLDRINKEGGIGFVAYSVEDVTKELFNAGSTRKE